jgi:hypothetical protein
VGLGTARFCVSLCGAAAWQLRDGKQSLSGSNSGGARPLWCRRCGLFHVMLERSAEDCQPDAATAAGLSQHLLRWLCHGGPGANPYHRPSPSATAAKCRRACARAAARLAAVAAAAAAPRTDGSHRGGRFLKGPPTQCMPALVYTMSYVPHSSAYTRSCAASLP